MSAFDDSEFDSLEEEIGNFLENHSITDLMQIVMYCVHRKEYYEYLQNGDN